MTSPKNTDCTQNNIYSNPALASISKLDLSGEMHSLQKEAAWVSLHMDLFRFLALNKNGNNLLLFSTARWLILSEPLGITEVLILTYQSQPYFYMNGIYICTHRYTYICIYSQSKESARTQKDNLSVLQFCDSWEEFPKRFMSQQVGWTRTKTYAKKLRKK